MKIHWELVLVLVIARHHYAECQTFFMDPLGPLIRMFMDVAVRTLGGSSENAEDLRAVDEQNRLQPKMKDDTPFPCPLNNTRSKTPPTSVHKLRPGDIDVIGAMGDSLSVGQGILASFAGQLLTQGRGLSFTGGGQKTWRQFLTLANILKEFNPHLMGYSLKDSFLTQNASQFNVAEGGALTKDMLIMAQYLIKRMEDDPMVNVKTDWKVISIFFGVLDYCLDVCFLKSPESVVNRYRKELTMTLRMLKHYLPRTLINIIPPIALHNVRSATSKNRSGNCNLMVTNICPCLFGNQFQNQQDRFDKIRSKWQQVQNEVVNSPEFDAEDFAIVQQPFLLKYSFPKTKDGLTDYSHLSGDCIHMSQKENARAALSLWNNMLEPVGRKATTMSNLYDFKCQTADQPYIFTKRNSLNK